MKSAFKQSSAFEAWKRNRYTDMATASDERGNKSIRNAFDTRTVPKKGKGLPWPICRAVSWLAAS